MKIALVHELLTMKGGAERVLKIFADMFPDAPIYTLLYDEKKLGDWFPPARVIASNAQQYANRLPLIANRFNHHLHLRRFPSAVESWDFSDFDLVLSSSSAFAHGIITNGKPKHLCYVQSPARYLWDRTHDVLDRAGQGFLGPLKRAYLSRTFHKLRMWDAESADRPDHLLAASKTVQRRIELYWRRESDIVHPPVDDFWLRKSDQRLAISDQEDYFLIVSTLVPYKRIEIAIEACNRMKMPLKIAGDGTDRRRLESMAGPTVEFLGFQSDEQLRALYSRAQATLFPGDEDFGIVPLESMACGTPVIAWRGGGALETVIEGKTGEFFEQPNAESLQKIMSGFDKKSYATEACREQAARFSRRKFEEGIRKQIDGIIERQNF